MTAPPPSVLLAPRPAAGRAGGRCAAATRTRAGRTLASLPKLPALRATRETWAAAVAALVLAVAVVASGCAPVPSAAPPVSEPPGGGPGDSPPLASSPVVPPPTAGPGTPTPSSAPGGAAEPELLLLADGAGGRTLSLLRRSSDAVALPVPDPTTVAVTPLADGSLVALAADGRAFLAPRGVAGLLADDGWRTLALAGSGSLPAGAWVAFGATLDPGGTTLAAIARPPEADLPGALLLVHPALGRREILPLPGQLAGTPPAWVDEARLAILERDHLDRTELVICETASGTAVDRIALRALDLRTSGDGRTAAVLGDEDRLLVGSTADLLARRAVPAGGPAAPAGDTVRGGLALDATGRRLAVIVDEGDGGRSRVAIYEQVGRTWRAGIRLTSPAGARGGAVTWLP